MDAFVQIPVQEYEAMKEEIALLKDNVMLQKMNRLLDILFQEKYGMYLGNNTSDLTQASIDNSWQKNSAWDNV